MATKTVSTDVTFYDKFVQLGVRLLEYYNQLDVKRCYTVFLEALMACACSCFPTMDLDSYNEDEDSTLTEQNKVNTQQTR